MMPPSKRQLELTPENIAMALIKGGLSLSETNTVIERIKFDESTWDGSLIIK